MIEITFKSIDILIKSLSELSAYPVVLTRMNGPRTIMPWSIIRLQVFDNAFHFVADHCFNNNIAASISEKLNPSPDLVLMIPEFIFGIIWSELVL